MDNKRMSGARNASEKGPVYNQNPARPGAWRDRRRARRNPSVLDAHYHRSRGNIHGLVGLLAYHNPSAPGEAAQVRQAAAAALTDFRDPRAIDSLIRALKDSSPMVQIAAAEGLGHMSAARPIVGGGLNRVDRARILSALFPLLNDESDVNEGVRSVAAEAIYQAGGRAVLRPLLALARRASPEFQRWFVRWAGRTHNDELLIDLYPWAAESVRELVVEHLRAHLSQPVLRRLEASRQPCDEDVEGLIQRVFG